MKKLFLFAGFYVIMMLSSAVYASDLASIFNDDDSGDSDDTFGCVDISFHYAGDIGDKIWNSFDDGNITVESSREDGFDLGLTLWSDVFTGALENEEPMFGIKFEAAKTFFDHCSVTSNNNHVHASCDGKGHDLYAEIEAICLFRPVPFFHPYAGIGLSADLRWFTGKADNGFEKVEFALWGGGVNLEAGLKVVFPSAYRVKVSFDANVKAVLLCSGGGSAEGVSSNGYDYNIDFEKDAPHGQFKYNAGVTLIF